MRSLRSLLCLALLAPSCTAQVPPADDEPAPAPAPLADPWTPLYPGPRVDDPNAPCLSVIGPAGFSIVVPIPCLQLWIDMGDPAPAQAWGTVRGGSIRVR